MKRVPALPPKSNQRQRETKRPLVPDLKSLWPRAEPEPPSSNAKEGMGTKKEKRRQQRCPGANRSEGSGPAPISQTLEGRRATARGIREKRREGRGGGAEG